MRFSAGVGKMRFAAPSGGATGSVEVTANLDGTVSSSYCQDASGASVAASSANMSYLWGRWSGGTSSSSYGNDPTAHATFGLFGAVPKKFIFQRENY